MQTETLQVDIFESETDLFLVGNGITLKVMNVVGPVEWEITDSVLHIGGNETKIMDNYDPWQIDDSYSVTSTNVYLEFYSLSEHTFVNVVYENIPAYSPIYGVVDGGRVYKITTTPYNYEYDPIIDTKPCNDQDRCYVVENVETGLNTTVSPDDFEDYFNETFTPVAKID